MDAKYLQYKVNMNPCQSEVFSPVCLKISERKVQRSNASKEDQINSAHIGKSLEYNVVAAFRANLCARKSMLRLEMGN